ncbi:MAG: amidohydrolase family protein [Gammaproteobacteria bacterium]|nr:amidohydrolase family protein [Gammaproteobacteria bacterium]
MRSTRFEIRRYQLRVRYMLMMQNTEEVPYAAMREALGWDWTTFPEYMEHLRRIPKGVNVATYLPMNPLLRFWMTLDETLEVYSQSFSHRSWTEFNAIDNSGWDFNPQLREFTSCGDAQDKVRKAADPDFRKRMRENYDPAVMIPAGGPIDTWLLVDAHGSKRFGPYEGALLGEVARREGLHITDAFFEIVVDSNGLADFRTSEAMSHDLKMHEEILRNERVIPGTSDGGAHVKFYSGGQYSTDLLTWMARDEQRFTLEQIHWRLSSLPARVVGLSKRGELRKGYAADLIVYDLDRLGFNRDRYDLVRDLPGGEYRRICRAQGIDHVIVGGESIVEAGNCTTALPGTILTNH